MPLSRKFKKLFQPRQPSRQPTDSPLAPEPFCEGQPLQTIDGPALTALNPRASPALVGGGENYGIKVLYHCGNQACVDIVFVHGLTGNAYNTWLYQETGIHWPSKFLGQDIPDSRILSFGYDADVFNIWSRGPASKSRLSNHAESLVGKLVRERERSDTEDRKIIFVAHSLGGLVTEQALTHSKNSAEKHLNQIERSTIGIVFLGVPHCGSDLEAWATVGRRMVSLLVQTNKDIVNILNPDSEMLHMVENSFHTIIRQRKDNPIEITCFYEELPVKGVGEIVPQRSAKIAGYKLYPIHANHMEQRIFVISGIGGTGKSEVCLKFAEDHRDEYWGVLWLDARNNATAEQGLVDIGRRCGVPEPSVANVKSWLACKDRRWLLVIDNADNPDVDYSPYIPSGKRGDILLSTRNLECILHATVGHELLGDLELELARELLFKTISVPESQWKEKEEAATDLIDILGSHTLAIIQAGAFIRQRLCTLEEYPSIFRQQRDELLKFYTKQNESTYRNVYATFEVAAEHLQTSELPERSDALTLLHTLAFMYNGGISEEIFQRASRHAFQLKDSRAADDEELYSLSKRHVARLPEYIQQEWSRPSNRLRWRKALQTLYSLSVITVAEDNGPITISLHPLVHAWAKERQDPQTQSRAWQSAATTLALSCEGHYDFCPFFVIMQPHVRACVSHEVEKYTQNMSAIEIAQILFQLAYLLYRTGDHSSFSSLVQQTRLIIRQKHGVGRGIVIQVLVFTGRVALQQGDFGKAVKLRERVVKIEEKLAEDDPDRLTSQHELACAYQANGQIDKAIKLLEHVVNIQEKLAKDHPARLVSQHTLARAYQAGGRIDEAVKLLEHVVKIRIEKLAEDHPHRLVSQHELAAAYQANGRIDEAIKLLEHIVKIQEDLAEDHPHRLTSQYELARAYQADGRIDEAIKLLEHTVKIRIEKLAEDHPDRLVSVQLLEHVVKKKERLVKDDPNQLTSQHALSSDYQAPR
ncbi:MAG: hypothetical protein Q9181_007550 [Wetmoreana brouardii]